MDKWLAGFFDGEGNISLTKGYDKRWQCHWWGLDIQVVNTIVANVKPFEDIFGGEIRERKQKGNRKRQYVWRPPDKLKFLQTIEPYLIGKSIQAKLAIEFLGRDKAKGGGNKLTQEQIAYREKCYQQFKILNKRGR